MNKNRIFTLLSFLILGFLVVAPAMAGQPVDWQLGMQDPASPLKERLHEFHDMMLYIIFGIAIFVLVLLAYVIMRYNAKANPTPSKITHNVTLEVIWTVIPVIILIVIAIPSLKLLYYTDRTDNPEMTLKVTGHAWYWNYLYPDHDNIRFDSYMIPEDEVDEARGDVRLLSVDNKVVLPVDTNIQILMTGGDVIHSWTVPALGVKIDAIPGRMNEAWVRITKPGTYFGQCSEICGKNHAYMPIEIVAVSKEEFENWLTTAKEEFAEVAPQNILDQAKLAYFKSDKE